MNVSEPWDERYGRPGYYYGEAPNEFLVAVEAQLPRSAEVLSIGEGEGRNAVFLASRGHRVTGLDQSAAGLEKARRLAAARGVEIATLQADLATCEPGTERWDAVVSIWVHLPPPARSRVHAACVRALRPGGLLILEAYRPGQQELGTGGPPDPARLYSLDGLRDDFRGLTLVHAVETTREVWEGVAHCGLSAVVQIVGRK